MVDDGFLIGFEDSSGNFVEVGRFNNTADDVTQPLEIKHQNSGERITLDDSGLKMQKIDDDRLYAGAFSGSDPDTRLSNALTEANNGDTIFLEGATYQNAITINKRVNLIGTHRNEGTTFNADVTLSQFGAVITEALVDATLELREGTEAIHATSSNPISVVGNEVLVTQSIRTDVTLQGTAQRCIVDNIISGTVTNNGGSSNQIGEVT
jgi:hypothetical protein